LQAQMDRRLNYKNKGQFRQEELKKKREEQQVEIRKQKREESIAKRRNLQSAPSAGAGGAGGGGAGDSDEDEAIATQLDSQLQHELPQMVAGVFSDSVDAQLDCTTKFRKLLSKERNPPIERVINAVW